MKEKILRWGELMEYTIKQCNKICLGGTCCWYIEIDSYVIHEIDFKAAKLKGFKIDSVEAITDLYGKFQGLALWCTEEKGL